MVLKLSLKTHTGSMQHTAETGKNELLFMKNLLKPVKFIDKPVCKPEFEFENVKLRKTEAHDNKTSEKHLTSNDETEAKHEFNRISLRKTKPLLENHNQIISKVPRKNDIKFDNKETLLGSASILRKKSVEETQESRTGDCPDNVADCTDSSEHIKLVTKQCFKDNQHLTEKLVENCLGKVEIPRQSLHNSELKQHRNNSISSTIGGLTFIFQFELYT